MKILIANDDGIEAAGIKALVEILEPLGEIFVSAPAEQQTAKGHSVTLHQEVKVQEVEFKPGINAYKVWGTPKDCIDIAVQCLLDFKPDLIVTGINEGPNLANDCVSSGTLGAATAGFLNGVPSIACSLDFGDEYNYMKTSKYIREIATWFLKQPFNKNCLLNVNFPNIKNEFKGVVITRNGGTHTYTQAYQVRRENEYLYVTSPYGTPVMENVVEDLEHDIYAFKQGYVVISPTDTDLIKNEIVDEVRKAWLTR